MNERSRTDAAEDVAKGLIVLLVAAAALGASFTHVHDWTVRMLVAAVEGSTPGDMTWYGWANACISELVPLAGLLSLRRRIASGMGLRSYALGLVLAGAVLSIGAQLAWVKGTGSVSVSAAFLAMLPAMAFIALSKLVMSDLDVIRKRKLDAERSARAEAEEAAARAEAFRVQLAQSSAPRPVRPARRAEVVTLPNGEQPPKVDGVSPAIVARVLTAHAEKPGATRQQLAIAAGTSDRTVRTVLNSPEVSHSPHLELVRA
jgi:MFS family permease